jgi:hypothetical protein
MSGKLLKIKLERFSGTDPEINVWNIFDSEHPPFVHGKRKTGEGMEPSYFLYENDALNVTLDTQKLPFFSFLKYRSVMVHIATPDHSVVQFSSFFGVPTLQKYSASPTEGGPTKYTIQIVFYLTGLWKPLAPLIRWYVSRWLANTWAEDLVMKERRQKFLALGFRDMVGLPARVSDRDGRSQKLRIPLPRAKRDVESHPFFFPNLADILD